jgi:hypothetical protein
MRGRKIIHVYAPEQDLAEEWAYVLRLQPRYRTFPTWTRADLIRGMLAERPDGVLIIADQPIEALPVVRLIEAMSGKVRALIAILSAECPPRPASGGAHEWVSAIPRWRIMEQLKAITRRKSGPKKVPDWPPQTLAPEVQRELAEATAGV